MPSTLQSPPVQFEFPDVDLMRHLIDCYFDNLNILLPLLHRPSFVRSIEEGLHHVDHNFGATVLLVCAIGCRYSEDPRISHEITTSTSCTAWLYFKQLHKLHRVEHLPHSLHEAQTYPVRSLHSFQHRLIDFTKACCALSGRLFASRDALGGHRSRAQGHAR